MSKYSIDSTTLTSIGNAIRTKEGSSAQIPVADFATRISNLPSGGGSGGESLTQNVYYLGNTFTGNYNATADSDNTTFSTTTSCPILYNQGMKRSLKYKYPNINNLDDYNLRVLVYFIKDSTYQLNQPIQLTPIEADSTISVVETFTKDNSNYSFFLLNMESSNNEEFSFCNTYSPYDNTATSRVVSLQFSCSDIYRPTRNRCYLCGAIALLIKKNVTLENVLQIQLDTTISPYTDTYNTLYTKNSYSTLFPFVLNTRPWGKNSSSSVYTMLPTCGLIGNLQGFFYNYGGYLGNLWGTTTSLNIMKNISTEEQLTFSLARRMLPTGTSGSGNAGFIFLNFEGE